MSDESEPSLKPVGEKEKTCLGFGSLLLVAIRQALRESGGARDPARLAELEAQWNEGTAGIGVYLQGDFGDPAGRLYVSAVAMAASPLQDPFTGNALRIVGNLILSRADLDALGEPMPVPRREDLN